MNEFNENEFLDICRQLHAEPKAREISIRYPGNSFFNKMKKSIESDRRGEVVFAVIRPNGKIITVTCEEYPKGIFRIPTGGINDDEDILEAVYREVKEELGLEVEIIDFPGVLKIRFEYGNESIQFYSYLFILKEVAGNLLVDAADDEVSEIIEADLQTLESIVHTLNSIQGQWSDWGKFRYESSNAILEYLKLL